MYGHLIPAPHSNFPFLCCKLDFLVFIFYFLYYFAPPELNYAFLFSLMNIELIRLLLYLVPLMGLVALTCLFSRTRWDCCQDVTDASHPISPPHWPSSRFFSPPFLSFSFFSPPCLLSHTRLPKNHSKSFSGDFFPNAVLMIPPAASAFSYVLFSFTLTWGWLNFFLSRSVCLALFSPVDVHFFFFSHDPQFVLLRMLLCSLWVWFCFFSASSRLFPMLHSPGFVMILHSTFSFPMMLFPFFHPLFLAINMPPRPFTTFFFYNCAESFS